MQQAGYSKKPLIDKLGIKNGSSIVLLNAPAEFVNYIKTSATVKTQLKPSEVFIHYFAKDKQELEREFSKLKKSLDFPGMLWISWPKKSSSIKTDLSENIIREIGLKNGLVDVKVAAIDENWSGLKFVYRLKHRS